MPRIPQYLSIEPPTLKQEDWLLLDAISDEIFIALFYVGKSEDAWEVSTLALLKQLILVAGHDTTELDRFFRPSALFTAQWDSVRRNGVTWGTYLALQAIRESCAERGVVPPEIVAGVIREGQICVLTGDYNVGKSPLVRDLAFHIRNGLPWLGRATNQRQVVVLDFETPPGEFRSNVSQLHKRYGGTVSPLASLYLAKRTDGEIHPLTQSSFEWRECFAHIRGILEESADTLIIIDPAQDFFHFNRNRSLQVVRLFLAMRRILSEFSGSAMLLVMNQDRRNRRRGKRNLHDDPYGWLEGVAGDLDVLNRSDVRLGLDFFDDAALRVINGVRRGEARMSPIIVRPVGEKCAAGFEAVHLDGASLLLRLTKGQRRYWEALPPEFHFEQIVARRLVPRTTLSRLLKIGRSVGLFECSGGVWRKI